VWIDDEGRWKQDFVFVFVFIGEIFYDSYDLLLFISLLLVSMPTNKT